MEINYSGHAVERMQQRKISPAEVAALILSPDGAIKQSMDKTIFYKRVRARKDNLLAVVAVGVSVDRFEILTVMNYFEVAE